MLKKFICTSLILLLSGAVAGCASFRLSPILVETSLGPITEPPANSEPYRLVISVREQKMMLLKGQAQVARYLISTAKNGVGEAINSHRTPLGRHAVAEKIGAGAPIGAVFEDRQPTGQIAVVNEPNQSPIVTRILRLRGLEDKNQTTFQRYIYVQGTSAENLLGSPVSGGNIRMRSEEIVDLFERVAVGTEVLIFEEPMEAALTLLAALDKRSADLLSTAEWGVTDSFSQLCFGYMYGARGLPRNDVSALRWCSRAADKGDINAITLLGELHEQGRGVLVDFVTARQFYERAAKLGHPYAQLMAAQMYKAGIGGVADEALAKQYLELSAKQGLPAAVKLMQAGV